MIRKDGGRRRRRNPRRWGAVIASASGEVLPTPTPATAPCLHVPAFCFTPDDDDDDNADGLRHARGSHSTAERELVPGAPRLDVIRVHLLSRRRLLVVCRISVPDTSAADAAPDLSSHAGRVAGGRQRTL
jgi:hypothetical protein